MQPAEPAVALATREIEALRWIVLRYTQSEVATRMGLSAETVNTYAKRIRRKPQVGNTAEITGSPSNLDIFASSRALLRYPTHRPL